MYMLNLVFDLRKNDGLFYGDDPTPGSPLALRRSLNWLELIGETAPPIDPTLPPPNDFDPEAFGWTDLGQAETLLLPGNPDPGWICLRAVNDQRGPAPAVGDTVQFVAAFGRPARFHQPQASPFTHDGTAAGRIVTTFVSGPLLKQATSRGWFFALGQIAKRPGHPKKTHRYEFAVGLIVTHNGQEFYYGEDPEMDIAL